VGFAGAGPCRIRMGAAPAPSEPADVIVVGCMRTGGEGRGVTADGVEELRDIHAGGGGRHDRGNPGCHGPEHRLDERGVGLVGPYFDQFHFAGGDVDGGEV